MESTDATSLSAFAAAMEQPYTIINNNFFLKSDKEMNAMILTMMKTYASSRAVAANQMAAATGTTSADDYMETALAETSGPGAPKRKHTKPRCLDTYRVMVIEPKTTNRGPGFAYTCLPGRDSIAKHIEKRQEPRQYITLTLEHEDLKMTDVIETLKKPPGLITAHEIKFGGTVDELYAFLKEKLGRMDNTEYVIMKVELVAAKAKTDRPSKTSDAESSGVEEYVPRKVAKTSDGHDAATYTATRQEAAASRPTPAKPSRKQVKTVAGGGASQRGGKRVKSPVSKEERLKSEHEMERQRGKIMRRALYDVTYSDSDEEAAAVAAREAYGDEDEEAATKRCKIIDATDLDEEELRRQTICRQQAEIISALCD